MNTAQPQPSWPQTTLSLICEKITDGSHNPPKKQSTGLPMLSAKNIKDREINFSEGFRLISKEDFEQETKRTQVKEGDVLLTIVGALGRPAIVEQSHLPLTLQRSVAVLKPSNAINSKYLCYALEAPEVQSFINKNAK